MATHSYNTESQRIGKYKARFSATQSRRKYRAASA